jgi:hypothetical protein
VYHAREEIVDHLNLYIFFVPMREKVSRVSSVGVSQRLSSPTSSYKQTNAFKTGAHTFKQTISFYFHVRDAKNVARENEIKHI